MRPGPSSVRILVVDDHEGMLDILSTVLRALGFTQLGFACDGEEALRVLPTFCPDLIITDLRMPVLDGIGLVRRLRADANNIFTEAPVIMVTGHAHEHNVRAALAAGVNEFLAKPVTGRNLAERIRRVVEDDRPFLRTESYIGPKPIRGLIPAGSPPAPPSAARPAGQTPGSAPSAARRPAA